MKKFLISLVFLTSISQSTSLELGNSEYYEDNTTKFTTSTSHPAPLEPGNFEYRENDTTKFILEKGHELFLQSGILILSKTTTLDVKQGGIIKIGPEFSLKNIIVKDKAEIIDENLKITLTALSSQEDWERWIEFYKLPMD